MSTVISTAGFGNALTTDQGITLSNEEFARKMSIGSNWTTLRVGIHGALSGDSTSGLSSAAMVVGLCSGTSATYAQGSTTNFIGANLVGQAATGTISANFNPPWWLSVSGACILRRVAASTTIAGNTSFGWVPNGVANARRFAAYLDITKGSPNYTIKVWGTHDGINFGEQGVTTAGFLIGLATAIGNTPQPTGNQACASGINNATTPCDEIAGGFDSVNIFWNQSAQTLNLYQVSVYRFA